MPNFSHSKCVPKNKKLSTVGAQFEKFVIVDTR